MNKGTHFIGQPVYGQLLNLLDKEKTMEISRENGGERYVKKFDVWQHLAIMLYAVIKRYDSMREITGGMLPGESGMDTEGMHFIRYAALLLLLVLGEVDGLRRR